MRPAPRAAVVARPRVEALTALAAKEGPEHGGADRDRRLEPLLRDLLALALDRLACAAESLLERGLLGRVLSCGAARGVVALLAAGVLQADPEVALGLAGPRDGLEARAAQEVEPLCAVEPGGEILSPGA